MVRSFCFGVAPPALNLGAVWCLAVGDSIGVPCDLASVFQISWIQTFPNLGDLIEYILK